MFTLLVLTVLLLAWSNGANDIFKGVASLHGSGAASYRTALGWGIISTAAGSLAAIILAAGLLHKFSGKGLVPDEVFSTPAFVVSVALGAGVRGCRETPNDDKVFGKFEVRFKKIEALSDARSTFSWDFVVSAVENPEFSDQNFKSGNLFKLDFRFPTPS